ncbi:MAG: DUF1893 domain-containing protein [Thermoguttaceae bacterium]|nr:DUF1893 domain-containing protein [Thermoguttaceae bacterium]
MNGQKTLRLIRIVFATMFLVGLVAAFFGLSQTLWITTIQFSASAVCFSVFKGFLTSTVITLALILLTTLLFGRLYCAVLCPLGVTQDFCAWLTRRKGSMKRNCVVLRYFVAAVVFGALTGGCVAIFRTLDPYSIFGSALAVSAHSTALEYVGAILPLFLVLALVLWKRRLFCVTLCPVGTLLGLVAQFSFWKIRLDADKCKGCKLCEKACPTGCINAENKLVDNERCVRCMNCLGVCRHSAARFSCTSNKADIPAQNNMESDPEKNAEKEKSDVSRRKFLGATATGVVILGVGSQHVAIHCKNRKLTLADSTGSQILPPGARNRRWFSSQCIDCGLCSARCPERIIRPAVSPNGLVHLDFSQGGCDIHCKACEEACPTHAIAFGKYRTRRTIRIANVGYDPQYCLSIQGENEPCAKCAEICPSAAIIMKVSPTGFHIPQLNENMCIGCGKCYSVCEGYTNKKALFLTPLEPQRLLATGQDVLRDAILAVRGTFVDSPNFATPSPDCVVIKDGAVIDKESGKGLKPLLALAERNGEKLQGAIVVDKVIGRAAAAILICAKVAYVHGELMSADGVAFLTMHGVAAGYRKLVPLILNRDMSGRCPLELLVDGIDNPEKAVETLKGKQK